MAAESKNVDNFDVQRSFERIDDVNHDYVLERDLVASARLNLQYFLLKETLGYSVHPSISIQPHMRVADIATGTGIWALDVSRSLPSTVSFECFDISADQFPPTSILPPNIKFGTFDGTKEIPAELVGKFDVVHVALLVAVVKNYDPTSWIQNLMKLLKPGGCLMWVEGNFKHSFDLAKESPLDPKQYPGIGKLVAQWVEREDQVRKMGQWVIDLGKHFESCGLQDVQVDDRQTDKALWKAFTEVAMLTQAEMVKKGGNPDAIANLSVIARDVANGAIYPGLNPLVAVGKKAA